MTQIQDTTRAPSFEEINAGVRAGRRARAMALRDSVSKLVASVRRAASAKPTVTTATPAPAR